MIRILGYGMEDPILDRAAHPLTSQLLNRACKCADGRAEAPRPGVQNEWRMPVSTPCDLVPAGWVKPVMPPTEKAAVPLFSITDTVV